MRTRVLTFISVLLAVATASAHGPQIQITNSNNKIVTRELIGVGPYGNSLTPPKLLYVIPILQAVSGNPSTAYWQVMPNSNIDPILGVSAYQFGPGLAFGYRHTFDAGQHFTVSFTDSLKRWNGATFAANDGAEEIGAFRGDSTIPGDTAFTTDNPPFQSLIFPDISPTYNGESHSSLRFRALGDGVSALVQPRDGLYLMGLQIASTQPGVAESDPFYLMLYKNVSSTDLATAVTSLGIDTALVQYLPVPEPAASVNVAVGTLILLYSKFRRRQ